MRLYYLALILLSTSTLIVAPHSDFLQASCSSFNIRVEQIRSWPRSGQPAISTVTDWCEQYSNTQTVPCGRCAGPFANVCGQCGNCAQKGKGNCDGPGFPSSSQHLATCTWCHQGYPDSSCVVVKNDLECSTTDCSTISDPTECAFNGCVYCNNFCNYDNQYACSPYGSSGSGSGSGSQSNPCESHSHQLGCESAGIVLYSPGSSFSSSPAQYQYCAWCDTTNQCNLMTFYSYAPIPQIPAKYAGCPCSALPSDLCAMNKCQFDPINGNCRSHVYSSECSQYSSNSSVCENNTATCVFYDNTSCIDPQSMNLGGPLCVTYLTKKSCLLLFASTIRCMWIGGACYQPPPSTATPTSVYDRLFDCSRFQTNESCLDNEFNGNAPECFWDYSSNKCSHKDLCAQATTDGPFACSQVPKTQRRVLPFSPPGSTFTNNCTWSANFSKCTGSPLYVVAPIELYFNQKQCSELSISSGLCDAVVSCTSCYFGYEDETKCVEPLYCTHGTAIGCDDNFLPTILLMPLPYALMIGIILLSNLARFILWPAIEPAVMHFYKTKIANGCCKCCCGDENEDESRVQEHDSSATNYGAVDLKEDSSPNQHQIVNETSSTSANDPHQTTTYEDDNLPLFSSNTAAVSVDEIVAEDTLFNNLYVNFVRFAMSLYTLYVGFATTDKIQSHYGFDPSNHGPAQWIAIYSYVIFNNGVLLSLVDVALGQNISSTERSGTETLTKDAEKLRSRKILLRNLAFVVSAFVGFFFIVTVVPMIFLYGWLSLIVAVIGWVVLTISFGTEQMKIIFRQANSQIGSFWDVTYPFDLFDKLPGTDNIKKMIRKVPCYNLLSVCFVSLVWMPAIAVICVWLTICLCFGFVYIFMVVLSNIAKAGDRVLTLANRRPPNSKQRMKLRFAAFICGLFSEFFCSILVSWFVNFAFMYYATLNTAGSSQVSQIYGSVFAQDFRARRMECFWNEKMAEVEMSWGSMTRYWSLVSFL